MKDNFDRKYILEVWGIGAGIFRIFCDDFFVGLSGECIVTGKQKEYHIYHKFQNM